MPMTEPSIHMMHMTQEALSFPPTLPMGVPVVSGFFEKTRGGLSTQMSFLFGKNGGNQVNTNGMDEMFSQVFRIV